MFFYHTFSTNKVFTCFNKQMAQSGQGTMHGHVSGTTGGGLLDVSRVAACKGGVQRVCGYAGVKGRRVLQKKNDNLGSNTHTPQGISNAFEKSTL